MEHLTQKTKDEITMIFIAIAIILIIILFIKVKNWAKESALRDQMLEYYSRKNKEYRLKKEEERF